MMEAIIERCAGLDVHQATACVLIGEAGRKPHKEIRTFPAMTRDLEGLRDWLKEMGVTHVGMESTGVYWKPVHAILEGHFELIVANAHHIRNVPGRKTDVKDAEWLADLIRHGLVKPSFVPPPPIRELRDLVRLRRSLSEALTTEQNRTLKLLEHQVGQRGQRGVRRVRPGNDEGTDREHRHAAGDGGLGSAEVTPQAGAAGPCAGRSADRASPLPSTSGGSRHSRRICAPWTSALRRSPTRRSANCSGRSPVSTTSSSHFAEHADYGGLRGAVAPTTACRRSFQDWKTR